MLVSVLATHGGRRIRCRAPQLSLTPFAPLRSPLVKPPTLSSSTTRRGWTDGLPVVPPTQDKIDAIVAALGGDPQFVECKVAPRWGALTREVLAINMVMAGCRPELCSGRARRDAGAHRPRVQSQRRAGDHARRLAALIVNGPLAREIGMNGGANAFGSGNRANATIGRAIRLVMLNVGGGWPARPRQEHAWQPGQVHLLRRGERRGEPLRALSRRARLRRRDSTVFAIAAEAPHSVTDHSCNDPKGILDTMCSAMSTIASQQRGAGRPLRRGARTRARPDDRQARLDACRHPPLSLDVFRQCASRRSRVDHRYGKVYNRNLPKWYKREPGQPHPDRAVAGQHPPLRHRRRTPAGSRPSFPGGDT